MRLIKIGYSCFNADALEGKSLDELKEQYPKMRKDVFDELTGKLGLNKVKKDKPKKDNPKKG